MKPKTTAYFNKIRIVTVFLLCSILLISSVLMSARAGMLYLNSSTYSSFIEAKKQAEKSKVYYERVMGDIFDINGTKLTDNTNVLSDSKYVPYHKIYSHIFGNLNINSCGLLISQYNTLTSASPTDPKKGMSLILNVDDNLQRFIFDLYEGTRTNIVVLGRNGALLSAVSTYREDVDLGKLLKEQDIKKAGTKYGEPVFLPGYLTDEFAPGSVYKMFTSVLMAENGMDDFTYNDTGILEFTEGGSTQSLSNDGGAAFGEIDLKTAFLHSVNTYFGNAYLSFSLRQIHELSGKFLMDGQTVCTDIGDITSYTKFSDYTKLEKASSGIGQGGITVSTLGLAMMAQGALYGRIYLPRAVKASCYRDQYGDLTLGELTEETVLSDDIAADSTCELIKDLMANNAEAYGLVNPTGDPIYAKTGTAELTNGQRATLIAATDNVTVVISSISPIQDNIYGKSHMPNMQKILNRLDSLGYLSQ